MTKMKFGNGKSVYNHTTLFLVNTFGISKEKILEQGFIDSYLSDKNREDSFVCPVYLLFKPSDMDAFNLFVEDIKRKLKSNFYAEYDYAGGYVVLVLGFPQEFRKDYNLFLQGKYSKFSDKFKRSFPLTEVNTDEDGKTEVYISIYTQIFEKSEVLRQYWQNNYGIDVSDAEEYFSIVDKDKESLDIQKIINEEKEIL